MDFGGEGGRVDAHDDDAGLAVRQPVHRVEPKVVGGEAGPEDERVRRVVLGREPLLPVLRAGWESNRLEKIAPRWKHTESCHEW